MSDLVIRGEKMPEECDECPCFEAGLRHKCWARLKEVDYRGKQKPKWCPAYEIKGPHGRLIDADELLRRIQESGNYLSPAILAYIQTAETIVEADIVESMEAKRNDSVQ